VIFNDLQKVRKVMSWIQFCKETDLSLGEVKEEAGFNQSGVLGIERRTHGDIKTSTWIRPGYG
jgi:hypothetical protein